MMEIASLAARLVVNIPSEAKERSEHGGVSGGVALAGP